MLQRTFLFLYMFLTPLLIWSTAFILAIIVVWRNSRRDSAEERARWEDQRRAVPIQYRKKAFSAPKSPATRRETKSPDWEEKQKLLEEPTDNKQKTA